MRNQASLVLPSSLSAIHPDLALGKIDSFAPAAAVIDIGLPGMDGYQLASEIRRRLGGRPMRLIAFTDDRVARALQQCAEAGPHDRVVVDQIDSCHMPRSP